MHTYIHACKAQLWRINQLMEIFTAAAFQGQGQGYAHIDLCRSCLVGLAGVHMPHSVRFFAHAHKVLQ